MPGPGASDFPSPAQGLALKERLQGHSLSRLGWPGASMLASPGGEGKNFSPPAHRRDLATRLGFSTVEFSYFLSISFSGLDQYPSSKVSFFKVKLKLLLQMTTE